MSHPELTDVETALEKLRQGQMIILVDDESRENEGDLILAAEHVTPQAINFMSRQACGLICLAMQATDMDRLHIPLMTSDNRSKQKTAFGISFEAANLTGTGVSPADRAHTIKTAIAGHSGPNDIIMPGHVFPLQAKPGGVLVRNGHTEGSVDLARLAGCIPAAVICEIINPDGSMARMPNLLAFAQQHQLSIVRICDIINYRMQHETLITLGAKASLPITGLGDFEIQSFVSQLDMGESIALIKQPIQPDKPCLVRIHSECLTGDLFESARCDCGRQLSTSLKYIAKQGGILLYLRQEGRGIGLTDKIKSYALQDQGLDTVEANHHLGYAADHRDYGIAAQMLKALGITTVHLLTNNPSKVEGLKNYGINVAMRIPLEMTPNANNINYLRTKKEKLGHLLNLVEG